MRRLLLLLLAAAPVTAQVSQQPATAIVPVVSSAPGAAGANFRTGVQMTNDSDEEMNGWLLLRPHGIAVRYEIEPRATISWSDFVAEVGGSGAGSLDLIVEEGDLPTVVVRSYDDQPDGTKGVTVPLVLLEDILVSGTAATLIAPSGGADFRFNIGLRALQDGADLELIVRNASGVEKGRAVIDLAAHEFRQHPAEVLLGIALTSDDSIEVIFTAGAAIVYGSTVDNRSNDASLQLLRRR